MIAISGLLRSHAMTEKYLQGRIIHEAGEAVRL